MAKGKKEMSKDDILSYSNTLFKSEKYKNIIQLLDDKALENFRDAELYILRAKSFDELNYHQNALLDCEKALELKADKSIYLERAIILNNLKKHEAAIEEFNKIVAIDSNNARAYYNRALAYWDNKDYDASIEDYTKVIELDIHKQYAYYGRGIVWLDKNEFDSAISDFNDAIKIDPDYSDAFNYRGVAYIKKGQFKDAMKDFDKATELNPDLFWPYNNRGSAWREAKEYDSAINEYTKCIELDKRSIVPLSNRAITWLLKNDKQKALSDYNLAIAINPNVPFLYVNRGGILESIQEYTGALSDYDKALQLDSKYDTAIRSKARLQTILGEKVELLTHDSYDLINEAVKELTQLDKIAILGKSKIIFDNAIKKIRLHASSNMEEDLKYNNKTLVVHFTKLKSVDTIVSQAEESRLRLYNAVYMNDPEEGEVILQCLDDKMINTCFNEARKNEENNIYIGSFLPAHRHEDELIMWRTYGKDEHKNEASGCSVIIDTAFFDKLPLSTLYLRNGLDIDNSNEPQIGVQVLCRVLYYDRAEKVFVNDNGIKINEDIKLLKTSLRELIALKNINKSPEKDKAINKIVYHIISEVRYFFKSADYSFENEARVLQFMKPEDDKVKIDDNGGQWLPRRLYIESNKPILPYIRKIILGPKVPNPNQWIYLEAVMKKKGYDISLLRSECKYQ